mmetsp:Transcript_37666/g.120832  ORF Transcript_37666/g.120832 Transcript_37666/m.120832 type:complete len:172 (+) Transcript_37666:136-651(+)
MDIRKYLPAGGTKRDTVSTKDTKRQVIGMRGHNHDDDVHDLTLEDDASGMEDKERANKEPKKKRAKTEAKEISAVAYFGGGKAERERMTGTAAPPAPESATYKSSLTSSKKAPCYSSLPLEGLTFVFTGASLHRSFIIDFSMMLFLACVGEYANTRDALDFALYRGLPLLA